VSKIHSRAMLVSLKISAWSARKHDKKVSQEVADNHHASGDVGRYIKKLFPQDAKTYAALNTALGELRAKHYEQTLAWSDEGWRLLPIANHGTYTTMVRQERARIDGLLSDFIAEYPTLRDQARQVLNGMFKPEDYPAPLDLQKRYSIKVDFNPVPTGSDFRVELDTATLEEIARDTEDRVTQAVKQAQEDAVERLHECVTRISERLNDPKAIFRDSLIENARELTDVLTRLNVTDDPRIEELRSRVEQLAQVSPEALRTLPFQRATTASEADAILADMNAVFGEVAHA
jgi:hypothetical protein